VPAGRFGIDPVRFCELARLGVRRARARTGHGGRLGTTRRLARVHRGNLTRYWRPWWRRARRLRPLPLVIGLSPWFPVWSVLA